ncbi:MAG: hypothetical protein DHS20C18_29140 [Saprospiraceae bacterium]|nr:MAG: hypothetical protein DHS20C18_29140 [Saprospiraceae bacterium]
MNQYKLALFFLLILLFNNALNAQEDAPERIPEYPIPYEYPMVDGIKDVLNRVRGYYESTSPQKIIDEKGNEITDFSKLNEHAQVSSGFSSEWSYTHGVVLSAFDYIDDVTGDKTFFANNAKFYDFVIKHLPYFRKNAEKFGSQSSGWREIVNMHALDHCGSIGAAMIKTYQKNKNEKYLELINITADYISNKQFRLKDGTLARHRPQYQSIWADDIYMSVPFLANMAVLTGDNKYFDDAIKQILQMADRLYIPEKELFDHGWNVTSGDYDPRFYWGRANGWTLMAMAELLSVLPEDYSGRDKILHLYRSMVRSLTALQDGTGFWHNMLDKTNTYLETSCTAMFTFAIAKGINEGWINHVYGPVALTGWNAIKTRVLENGAVDGTCEGTTFAHDNTYYYYRGKSIYATHGYGPVLYAGAEIIRLLQNDKFDVQQNRINARNSTFHYRLKSEWPKFNAGHTSNTRSLDKPRVIVTSDGEIDDECSIVRFLLYANEWDIEGIITSSSQYHWQGHKWAGDDWAQPYLAAYGQVYPNLVKHDAAYPSPAYLSERTVLGNVKAEGEMDEVTAGSQLIVKVLLDESDDRPIWIQAWGGTNTIARALKTIEEKYPEKMAYAANKMRFFFIWEQDSTYQSYIHLHWGKYNIQTIICDQFWAIAYQWNKILPDDKLKYFKGDWMKSNILEGHGPLCSLYKAHEKEDKRGFRAGELKAEGDFRSEGDSPAFIFNINTGLRNMESPAYGGWGGRYINVRENTWLDPVPEPDYTYPEGRWYTNTAWGRTYMRDKYPEHLDLMNKYFKPITHWADALQNDFASRADWCVKPYEEANHPPVVELAHALDLKVRPGATVLLNAEKSGDPDGDQLMYKWWQYQEAGTYEGTIEIKNAGNQKASFQMPGNAPKGKTVHIICEVTDSGTPQLTRYQRLVVEIE